MFQKTLGKAGRTPKADGMPASRSQAAWSRLGFRVAEFRRNSLAMWGASVVIGLVVVAVFAPWLTSHSPLAQDLSNRLLPPSAEHLFGTDGFGRDIFARVLYGTRITLLVIGIVSMIVLPVGLLIGVVAGYFGGALDAFLMRVTDIFLAFPKLILALALVAAMRPSIESAVLAIAITSWPPYARLARVETMRMRRQEYVDAARIQGASAIWILRRHVVPLCLPSVVVRLTLDMSYIVLIAAGLGFLGMGAQPPQPEWGLMVAEGRSYILDYWWVATLPGVAILVVSLGFNLLGDGLRDVLDARSK